MRKLLISIAALAFVAMAAHRMHRRTWREAERAVDEGGWKEAERAG